jgi:ABC-type transport system involved in multi-copper enzyme maturation permease subunit
LRSRESAGWLLAKDWRELLASRGWWVMLALMGPLVGVSFTSAMRTYIELSRAGGSGAGVGEAFSPLVGIWAPTFSACELAAAFLLPFVAIRVVAGDRQSGALKLELQHPLPSWVRIVTKASVLLGAWLIATLAPITAVLLWIANGGAIHWPELATLMLGHVLNAGLTIALAAAAAMVADHPSTAAILTLSVTVGTWVLAFVAAVQGGVWEIAARYTPAAMVADFQHGLLRVDALLVSLALIALGLALATVWTRTGVPVRRRWVESSLAGLVAAVLIAAGARTRGSWDLSESRMNSFAAADEQALRQITSPLRIEAHLAPEDPRRSDLERQALGKLRRLLPQLDVVYVAESGTGLFEQSDEHYGEIRYTLDGRTATSRATTVEGVLDTLYELSGVRQQAAGIEVFRGHPMTTAPRGVGWMFYGMWPAVAAAVALARGRRQS